MTKSISFAGKFMLCAVLSLLLLNTVLLLGTDNTRWISPKIIFPFAALLFTVPYMLLPVWEYRERRKLPGLNNIINRVQYAIACLTGFCITIFGWKKLFNLQFKIPMSVADLAMSSQDGETLTWYYFGHSQGFGYIIAAIQILGGLLLFFRGTKLAALLLLLPVMLNITLINIFYQMNAGALLQSVVLTLSLVYIMLPHLVRIKALLFTGIEPVSLYKMKRQWFVACLGSLFSFMFILSSKHCVAKESSLYGEYEVTNLSVNGKGASLSTRLNKDSILTRVYFDMNNVCVLEYNSPGRRLISKYNFDETGRVLESSFIHAGEKSLLHALVNKKSNSEIMLQGGFGNDSLKLELHRIR